MSRPYNHLNVCIVYLINTDFSNQYIMNVDKEIFEVYAFYAAIVIMKMLVMSMLMLSK